MDVSVVIVSYNTSRLLDECIESIKKETNRTYEVIVVDNASSDDSCLMLHKKHPDVTLIENEHNVGFARANNQGFAIAQGRYYLMLNSDTVILDGAIDTLVDFMDRNQYIGICGPRNEDSNGNLQYSCDHFPSFWNSLWSYSNFANYFPKVPMFRRDLMRYWDYSTQRDVDKIMGCALLIRAEIFKRIGGLDDAYFMYFEETDLCYRSRKANFRTVYVPNARIVHYGGQSAKAQNHKTVINTTIASYYYASQYYFFRKNYGFFSMFAMWMLNMIYGFALLFRNAVRADRGKALYSRAKAKALISGALSTAIRKAI